MLRIVHTFALVGATPTRIRVEVTLRRGTPGIRTSGLAPAASRQAVERLRAVAAGLSLRIPGLRITVNFAPADIPKTGASFDLPLLIGILAGAEAIPGHRLARIALAGELGLDGSLRPIAGVLPIALQVRSEDDISHLIVPKANLGELAGVPSREALGADSVAEVLGFLSGHAKLDRPAPAPKVTHRTARGLDLADVRGQSMAKRALEIAAAGGHHLLLSGEPGSGKSMLAARFPGILPPMDEAESLEVSALHSAAGRIGPGSGLVTERPFRTPHHTISPTGMIGGGSVPRPGEATLAHRGVLFLDELPEFRTVVLESLRAPLEQGAVHICRVAGSVTFPARFQLIAAMNPCPCGYHGSSRDCCTCERREVRRYTSRISGPLLDRFDLRVDVPAVSWQDLKADAVGQASSQQYRSRVEEARRLATRRFETQVAGSGSLPDAKKIRDTLNSDLPSGAVRRVCRLDGRGESLLRSAVECFALSARGCDRVLRIARTIADLDSSCDVRASHLAEAIHFRNGGRPPAEASSDGGGPGIRSAAQALGAVTPEGGSS